MDINLAAVHGTLTNEPVRRELADGTMIVHFDVNTVVEREGHRVNVAVPIAWRNPALSAVGALVVGDDVVVIGRIERRFFRSGGHTQSRTEVVADRCLPARRTKTVRSALAAAVTTLEI